MKLYNEMKQKSKRESEELQLPLKSKDCNVRQGFRGNCDSQGKLGMCPSLAEPNVSGFPRIDFFSGERSFASGKRGFHPCFCLPACCNCPVALSEFATCFTKAIQLRIGKFQNMQLQQEKQTAKLNLLRKCGLLAHTSPTFLKNCWIKKLLFACGSFQAANILFINPRQTTFAVPIPLKGDSNAIF